MLVDHLKAKLSFQLMLMRAYLRRTISLIMRRADKLLPFVEVKNILRPYTQTYKGIKMVRLDQIVGSEGRHKDFDREFLPIQSRTRRKWESIALGYRRGVEFPPIKLYKIGNVYFVSDGNHRVSVAKCRGAKYIRAEIIECQTRVTLNSYTRINQLRLKGSMYAFWRRQGLMSLGLIKI